MANALPIRRVVLYKHGVAYFERRGHVEGSDAVHLDFKARDMNDVLKSMTVLDLSGGTIAAVSYDSTKPLEKLLEEATIRIPEEGSLTALLGQVKGARVRARAGSETVEGAIVGLERAQVAMGDAVVERAFLALLVDGALRTYPLLDLRDVTFLDATVRDDLEFYLATVLSSYKKDSKRVVVFALGTDRRELFVSYVLEAPVWKTSYRVLLDAEGAPTVQGWAVVDNTGDEDWSDVDLALVAGLPVSFVHDLYSPRYMARPVVRVETEAAAAPVVPQEAWAPAARDGALAMDADDEAEEGGERERAPRRRAMAKKAMPPAPLSAAARGDAMERSNRVSTVTREVGDLFEYRVDHPVTVRRNQSALVPILQRRMDGRRVLLWNRATREGNPMACIELKNTSDLTLEGGPLTVTEGDLYVGEAMLDTMKPGDRRLVPFAVELACAVSVDDASEQGAIYRAVVARGQLRIDRWQLRRTKVHVRHKAARPQVLFLEHPRVPGWDLVDTPAPAETTDGFQRFRLELQPGAETTFVVTERTKTQSHTQLSSLSDDAVRVYLSSGLIDERVATALREVAALRSQAAERAAEETRLARERDAIVKDQERIRANLKSLGTGESKTLSERLVRKLSDQEDQLEKLGPEIDRLARERGALEAQATRRLEALAFTADLGEPRR